MNIKMRSIIKTPFKITVNYLGALLLIITITMAISACEKPWNRPPRPSYSLTFDNSHNTLQALYGAFLHDESGKVALFSWLKGEDTTNFFIPFSDYDHYNCTVIKILVTQMGSSQDTTFELTTYHQLADLSTVFLRTPKESSTATELKIQFTGISSLDSIVIPNSTAIIQPQESNNFFGHYQIEHNGNFWIRARFNGDSVWKYRTFKNYAAGDVSLSLAATQFTPITSPEVSISLPYSARWSYQAMGETPGASPQWMSLDQNSDLNTLPFSSKIELVYPENEPYNRYRLNLKGGGNSSSSTVFYLDQIVENLPESIPSIPFNVVPFQVSDIRNIAVECSGEFDIITLKRVSPNPPSVTWVSYFPPALNQIVSHKLPDIPEELTRLIPALKNYNLGYSISVTGERFDNLSGFEEVQQQLLLNDNPYWKAEAGMTGIERFY